MRDGVLKLPYVGLPADGIAVVLELGGDGTLRATMSDWTRACPTSSTSANARLTRCPPR